MIEINLVLDNGEMWPRRRERAIWLVNDHYHYFILGRFSRLADKLDKRWMGKNIYPGIWEPGVLTGENEGGK